MNVSSRQRVLKEISDYILKLELKHAVRVGIDGITASGKSTFSRELADILRLSNREIISTTLDGFHNPRSRRHERGRESAEGYYYDAYDYSSIVEQLLSPLGPTGSLQYRTQVFDLVKDVADRSEAKSATLNSILVVDGSFALRRELCDYWDVRIYLDVDFTIAEKRASIRDAAVFGSSDKARNVTRIRYHGAHKIHMAEAQPKESAHFVVLNSEPLIAEITSRRF